MNSTFIEISPKEASQLAELRVTRGQALAIGNKVFSFAGPVGLEVAAQGYLSAWIEISSEDKANFVEVRLAEAPGILKATTIPASETTKWYLNGKLISVSSSLSVKLQFGEYGLTADNHFFEKETLKVDVRKGETTDLKINLKPIEGLLKLKSVPSGAVVNLNGKVIGQTPNQLEQAGGIYSIELNHPGRKTLLDKIEITNSRRVVERNYKLLFEDAFVSFRLEPSGGILLLNGQRLDQFQRARLDALRTHTVSYLKDGYFAETKQFQLRPFEEKKLAFILRKELGRVEIFSKPSGVVFINGKQVGRTPISIDLPAVAHDLVISKKGYRSFKQKLLPSSKTGKRIDVTLQTELQARLAENPETYKNSLGMTMRLFHPSSFKMGAPRGEKGQRANEFQRTIRLSKPIYVSTHEVTVEQFSKFRPVKLGPGNASFPITNVSWINAVQFCNWLSRQ
ncbi:MAG: PEGA domain-containing protein, partial [Nitrospinaceae bacterium]|nr:PEGA domain-containing protein [Nitrospinaceae bacterium]